MIHFRPIPGLAGSAASAARIVLLAAGLSTACAAHAANCSDAPVSGRSYYIVNKNSGLQLDVSGYSMTAGAEVVQWSARTQANQQWAFNAIGNGLWTIRAAHSGQALDLWSYNPSEDAPVKQYTYSGNPNQQWVVSASGDAYTIASNSSKKLLTVADKSPGTALKQHSDQQGSALQRWYFNPVDGKCSTGTTGAFGSFLGFNRILIGGALDESSKDHPTPDTINRAPFDLRYSYIHSAPAPFAACYIKCQLGCNSYPDGGWWGCWGMSSDGKWNTEPGVSISWTNNQNATHYTYNGQPHRFIQQWTWYSGEDIGKMQSIQNKAAGIVTRMQVDYAGAVNNPTLLKGYLDDYRFFLNKIGKDTKNLIELEPDFWGFLRVQDGAHPNDPHFVPAAVQAAGGSDCRNEENSVAGLVSCMIKMARTYTPNSAVGLHLSCWDINEPDSANRGPKACVRYYQALGTSQADFLVGDVTDRDAGWAQVDHPKENWKAKNYWWTDAQFDNFLARIKQVTEAFGKPMVLWQIPLGNMNQNNTLNHYQDDKVWHFFTKMDKVAEAHIVALQFGAGHNEQTGTETDGGYFLWYAQQYYAKGGVALK
jgi:hypothetical protein